MEASSSSTNANNNNQLWTNAIQMRDANEVVYANHVELRIYDYSRLNCELKRNQLYCIAAMRDLEMNPKIKVKLNNTSLTASNNSSSTNNSTITLNYATIETSIGVLKEQLGCGKTLIILGLILVSYIPNRPVVSALEFGCNSKRTNTRVHTYSPHFVYNSSYTQKFSAEYKNYISNRNIHNTTNSFNEPTRLNLTSINNVPSIDSGRLLTVYKKVFPQTIIFCSRPIAVQLANDVSKTSLKFLQVYDTHGLNTFLKELSKGESSFNSMYEVILVRCEPANITNVDIEVSLPHANKNNINLADVIADISLTQGIAWMRAVYDDYDIIRHNYYIPALFTWLVSGTTDNWVKRCRYFNGDICWNTSHSEMDFKRQEYNYHIHLSDATLASALDLQCVLKQNIIPNILHVRTSPNFAEEEAQLTPPAQYTYSIRVQAFRRMMYNNILLLSNNEINSLNETMCKDLFVNMTNECKNVSELFSHALHKNFTKIKSLTNEIDRINKSYNRAMMPSDVAKKLASLNEELDKYNAIIQRVKTNISANSCVICYGQVSQQLVKECDADDLIEKANGIVLLTCCCNMVCVNCFITLINKELSRSSVSQSSQCPTCRAPIKCENVLYINTEFDMKSILTDSTISFSDLSAPQELKSGNINYNAFAKRCRELLQSTDNTVSHQEETTSATTNGFSTFIEGKIQVMMDILNGQTASTSLQQQLYTRDGPSHVAGYEELTGNLPDATQSEKRFIIYIDYQNSHDLVVTALNHYNISYGTLEGTRMNIQKSVDMFRNGSIKVLLLRSTDQSAGLNLQFATDIIYMNQITHSGIKQSIGRLMRMGRVHKAYIHKLVYMEQ